VTIQYFPAAMVVAMAVEMEADGNGGISVVRQMLLSFVPMLPH